MESRFLAYTEALSLDTFVKTPLSGQSSHPCQYRAGKTDKVPALVQELQGWIERKRWLPPTFRYDPNTLELQWQDDNEQWQPLTVHPLYKAEVTGY